MSIECENRKKKIAIGKANRKRTMSTSMVLQDERKEIIQMSAKYAPSLFGKDKRESSQPKKEPVQEVLDDKSKNVCSFTPKIKEESKHSSLFDDNFNLLCLRNEQTADISKQENEVMNNNRIFSKQEDNDLEANPFTSNYSVGCSKEGSQEMDTNETNKFCQECSGEDLSDYITQVKTDIGRNINKELFLDKIVKASENAKFGFRKSKRECKMASATNPLGISSEEYGKFAIDVYKYLSYIKGLDVPTIEELKENGKLVTINRLKENKRLLVFDLDETLVHCIHNDKDTKEADEFLDIQLPNGKVTKAGFNIRPYWKEMMEEIKDDWEVVVFTASCKNYANTIVNYLDPEGIYFPHRFYRENCWLTPEGVYIKDLRIFHQWDLKDIILVDNAVYSFGFQLDNGIPIFPYWKGKDDKQLLYLKEYLKSIANKEIIPDLRKTFQMSNLYQMDIDAFLDYYEEDNDNEENANDILDQMFNFDSRTKSLSFQGSAAAQREKYRLSHGFSTPLEINRNSDSIAVSADLIQRNYSLHLQNNNEDQFIDTALLDSELLSPSSEQFDSESKPKIKKKKIKLCKLKKVNSQCISLIETAKYKAINECETPSRFIRDDTRLEANVPRDNNTPKRLRPTKKLKKKKKLIKEREDKKYSENYYELDNDDPRELAHQISLFAKARSKEEIYESSSSSSQKEEANNDLCFGQFSTGKINYISKDMNFSRSADAKPNRHGSLFTNDIDNCLNDLVNDQQNKKEQALVVRVVMKILKETIQSISQIGLASLKTLI